MKTQTYSSEKKSLIKCLWGKKIIATYLKIAILFQSKKEWCFPFQNILHFQCIVFILCK